MNAEDLIGHMLADQVFEYDEFCNDLMLQMSFGRSPYRAYMTFYVKGLDLLVNKDQIFYPIFADDGKLTGLLVLPWHPAEILSGRLFGA